MILESNPMKYLSDSVKCKTREIMFRGKQLETGEWRFGVPFAMTGEHTGVGLVENAMFYYDEDDPCCYNYTHFEILPETLCEYTGIDTVDGQRIFEDDVLMVKDDTPLGPESFSALVQRDESGYWKLASSKNYADFDEVKDGTVSAEIIGNIHDKPELLNLI